MQEKLENYLEAADMDKSWGSFISVSNDLTEAESQVAATVVGDTAREGLEIKSSEVLETNPNLVGSTAKGLEVVVLRGCFGEPKRSSLLALGCSNCGCSAKGIGSEVPNGSGGGQPKHKVII